ELAAVQSIDRPVVRNGETDVRTEAQHFDVRAKTPARGVYRRKRPVATAIVSDDDTIREPRLPLHRFETTLDMGLCVEGDDYQTDGHGSAVSTTAVYERRRADRTADVIVSRQTPLTATGCSTVLDRHRPSTVQAL